MNSIIASVKSSPESLSYNESSRSRASSDSGSLFVSQHNAQEEEFVSPINIYREHRGRLEEDKKSRTELDTEILDDDLYSPVQQEGVSNSTTPKELNTGNFASTTTKTIFGGITETNVWGYDMFNNNNMFGVNYQ